MSVCLREGNGGWDVGLSGLGGSPLHTDAAQAALPPATNIADWGEAAAHADNFDVGNDDMLELEVSLLHWTSRSPMKSEWTVREGLLVPATGEEGMRRSIWVCGVGLSCFPSLLSCFSKSNSWPRKLKFGDIVGRFSFTYLTRKNTNLTCTILWRPITSRSIS